MYWGSHSPTVRADSIEAPPEWSELLARHQEYSCLGDSMAQRLADAVIDGSDDLATLRALALAEASAMPPAHAHVDHAVRAAVLTRLGGLYAPVAQQNYDRVAADFDQLAQKFSVAAGLVDPETDAAEMVNAGPKQRAAWSDSERCAHRLTDAMAKLKAAAILAGVPAAEKGETLIPLVADVTALHRRRVWEAWRTTSGRTGRWGALLAIGATLRAADLDHLEPYRLPRPMEVKQIPHGIGIRQVSVDPEDDELVAVASG
jgi:hypothetical protein